MYTHQLLSLLVFLSPFLFILSIPTFAATLGLGIRHYLRSDKRLGICFILTGAFGLFLDAVVIMFIALDDPHGRRWDSIDSGLLTGVPTLFVLFVALFTVVFYILFAAWLLARSRLFSIGCRRRAASTQNP